MTDSSTKSTILFPLIQIVVVPDSSTAQKVPAIEGLVEYRKDKQELYVRSNKTWSVVPQENKVKSNVLHFFVHVY